MGLSSGLLVAIKGNWSDTGTVCDDSFGWDDADLICRSMGYPQADSFVPNQIGQYDDVIR